MPLSSEWHERFLRELEKNEVTPFLEYVARWAMTDVAGRSPAEINRSLVRMDYEFQFSKLTTAIAEAPGDAGAYAARGDLSAAHGRWERALEDLRKVAELNPEDHWNIHHIGALLVWMEDEEAYREFCEMMLSRWSDSETPTIAERTAKACLLLPTSDPEPIDPLMNTVFTVDESHWAYMYFLMLKGLHEYRHGRHESALAAARESRRRFTSRFVRFIASNHAIEAMAHFRLGRPDEARQSIAELERLVTDDLKGAIWGIVLTHDCDLLNHDFSKEHWVEVLLARSLEVRKADSRLTRGRNPRRLHFEGKQSDETCVLEASIHAR